MQRYVVLSLCVYVGAAMLPGLGAASSSRSRDSVFYLDLKEHQCGIAASYLSKTIFVVPCSNARHTIEIYAIRHGGWGHGAPPSLTVQVSTVRTLCLRAFKQITQRSSATPFGFNFFFPDPGSEQTRYGDKIICTLGYSPKLAPLGQGWHVLPRIGTVA
jgi:hypothetical protein